MKAIFILIEVSFLFYNVIIEHTKLFSAITDLICFILYIKFLRKNIKKPNHFLKLMTILLKGDYCGQDL